MSYVSPNFKVIDQKDKDFVSLAYQKDKLTSYVVSIKPAGERIGELKEVKITKDKFKRLYLGYDAANKDNLYLDENGTIQVDKTQD